MAEITAAMVKKLRDATGAGMMDCKKALVDADGDFDAAMRILQEKGAAKATARSAERTAADGLVVAAEGAMLEVNCETDFVAKSDAFGVIAARLLEYVLANRPADLAALLGGDIDGKVVEHWIAEQSAVVGEKVAVSKLAVFDGKTANYLHRRSAGLPPQVGVLVEYTGDDAEAARGAALHIAAMKPLYATRDEVPAEVVQGQREIAETLARTENKPEQAIPRIVEGKVQAYYKEYVLIDQPSVQDQKRSVGALLSDAGVTVTRFARFEVGQA